MKKARRVLIMGLGVHGGGLAAAKYFAAAGDNVTVTDLKPESELGISIDELKKFPNIKFVLGEHCEDDFIDTDLIIRNPAVPKESKYLKLAKDHGVDIKMQESVFFELCLTKNIIGVTGTKGKTSTAYLIYEVLKANGLKVHLAGNMKIPVISILPIIEKNDWVVLELSSWQCEALEDLKTSPRIAIITNISEDHLNRYKSYEDYAMSKSSIFKYQDSDGVFITLKSGAFTDKYLKLAKGKIKLFDPKDPQIVSNVELSKAKMKGIHNRANILAALNVSESLGLNLKKSLGVVLNFKGVPYRLEEIGKANEILFVNDTTATAPDAAVAAIKTYLDQKPVLIVGGTDKNLDCSELAKLILKSKIDYIMLKGTGTDKLIQEGLDSSKVFDAFEPAVKRAYELATAKQGIVLLSPGFASFGMFKHEFDRGDQFNEIFKKLCNSK